MNDHQPEEQKAGGARPVARSLDLLCFSHLRWNFVYQRPQHLLSRCARERRVFFFEEPRIEQEANYVNVYRDPSGVWVVVPGLRWGVRGREALAVHTALIEQLLVEQQVARYILWYTTPMALACTRQLEAALVVYDCMDELAAFGGAPPQLREYEAELLQHADLVFTGGQSLYEAKRGQHPRLYAMPSSVDVAHFGQARTGQAEPLDQAGIPHPRLGFFGVLDERLDQELLYGLAKGRPDYHLILIGPTAKVDPRTWPRRPNIHYLAKKAYEELPAYLAGWDAALLPFARSESTRFLSPTKVPEYLAGGKPVISTPIPDVVRSYGETGLVTIADGVEQFCQAADAALARGRAEREAWLARVDEQLAQTSWDRTWGKMSELLEQALGEKAEGAESAEGAEGAEKTKGEAGDVVFSASSALSASSASSASFDWLVVGAGLAGCVLAERLARDDGQRVLLIDRRPHIGGNSYDCYDSAGILVQKYGPHILHTGSAQVFEYLSDFTDWRPYEHRVLASVDGQLLPIPINLDTVNRLYGTHFSTPEMAEYLRSVAEPRPSLQTAEDVVLSQVGRDLYEKFFRNYTRKQWGRDPAELDAAVTARVPVRLNRDDRYFTDPYQSMPRHGFTRTIEALLDHPKIQLLLNADYREVKGLIPYRRLLYTGSIDEYFDYCYGRLPYRSIRFRFETLPERQHQPVAVVNYPNEHPYTRVTEFKHLTGQTHEQTTLVYEYPGDEGDPCYPIPHAENAALYARYRALADATPGVYFAGRLGTYRYLNMDQVIAESLALSREITGKTVVRCRQPDKAPMRPDHIAGQVARDRR